MRKWEYFIQPKARWWGWRRCSTHPGWTRRTLSSTQRKIQRRIGYRFFDIFTQSSCWDGLSYLFCSAWFPKHRTGLVLGTRKPLERKTTWRVPILTGEGTPLFNSNNNNNMMLTNIFNPSLPGSSRKQEPAGWFRLKLQILEGRGQHSPRWDCLISFFNFGIW